MSPDAWTFLGIMTTGLVTLAGIIVSSIKSQKQGADTSDQVEEVRRLAAPTGNGYAQKTESSLARIETSIENLTVMFTQLQQITLTHLSDHFRQNSQNGTSRNAVDEDSNRSS